MNKSLVQGALSGGLIVFIWGMISWCVIPWHKMTLNKFENEHKVAQVIMDNTPESGIYVLPNVFRHKEGASKEQIEKEMTLGKERMAQGPMMFASVVKEGVDPGSSKSYISWLILQIISAYLISWLLLQTKGLSYFERAGFVSLVGLVAGILCYLSCWLWWGFSIGYVIVGMLDLVIGWFLAGLALAKLIKK